VYSSDEILSKKQASSKTGGDHTHNIGTPSYASPEQLDPNSDYDHNTDIWSLGLILLELMYKMRTAMERSKVL
jgi:serine/threonine protein kinase